MSAENKSKKQRHCYARRSGMKFRLYETLMLHTTWFAPIFAGNTLPESFPLHAEKDALDIQRWRTREDEWDLQGRDFQRQHPHLWWPRKEPTKVDHVGLKKLEVWLRYHVCAPTPLRRAMVWLKGASGAGKVYFIKLLAQKYNLSSHFINIEQEQDCSYAIGQMMFHPLQFSSSPYTETRIWIISFLGRPTVQHFFQLAKIAKALDLIANRKSNYRRKHVVINVISTEYWNRPVYQFVKEHANLVFQFPWLEQGVVGSTLVRDRSNFEIQLARCALSENDILSAANSFEFKSNDIRQLFNRLAWQSWTFQTQTTTSDRIQANRLAFLEQLHCFQGFEKSWKPIADHQIPKEFVGLDGDRIETLQLFLGILLGKSLPALNGHVLLRMLVEYFSESYSVSQRELFSVMLAFFRVEHHSLERKMHLACLAVLDHMAEIDAYGDNRYDPSDSSSLIWVVRRHFQHVDASKYNLTSSDHLWKSNWMSWKKLPPSWGNLKKDNDIDAGENKKKDACEILRFFIK
jgi:hypothetical protein